MRTFQADPNIVMWLSQVHYIAFIEFDNVVYLSDKLIDQVKKIIKTERPLVKYNIGQSDIEIEWEGYVIC